MSRSGSNPIRASIAGATGYAGQELVRLLARHPDVTLTMATASQASSTPRKLPGLVRIWDGEVSPLDVDALIRESDVVFLALPEATSAELAPRFLAGLRAECDRVGALLIFDEVITGFRLGRGGAQEAYEVVPDLSCFGKVIGGGLNVGAFGGRAEIMDHLAPDGPVYQAGTLSGNPLATAAGLAALSLLDDAAYDLQAAISGGSLYAAAKVAAADPVEVERASARQRQAFERVQRARAACRDQVAA